MTSYPQNVITSTTNTTHNKYVVNDEYTDYYTNLLDTLDEQRRQQHDVLMKQNTKLTALQQRELNWHNQPFKPRVTVQDQILTETTKYFVSKPLPEQPNVVNRQRVKSTVAKQNKLDPAIQRYQEQQQKKRDKMLKQAKKENNSNSSSSSNSKSANDKITANKTTSNKLTKS